MKEMDPMVWFSKRQVSTPPRHFVRTSTPSNNEINAWVIASIKGRYSLISGSNFASPQDWGSYYYFEDPSEAMLYELRWSGN